MANNTLISPSHRSGATYYHRRGSISVAPAVSPRKPRRLMRLVTVIALTGLLVVGIQNAYPALTGSDFFQMKHIKVVGNTLLPEQDVVTTSGLTTGINLFECDLSAATKRLEEQPMIERALLIREPPETVVISMVERQPVAMINAPKELLGLDAKGVVFPLPSVAVDMPIVSGVHRDSTQVLAQVATFIATLKNKTPEFWREVSEICATGPKTVTVYLVGDGLPLRMKFEHPEQQVRNFSAYTAATSGATIDLAYVDLRFRDQVVVGRR